MSYKDHFYTVKRLNESKMHQYILRDLFVSIILCIVVDTSGNPIKPIHFEFHHRETFAISHMDDNTEDSDYDYEDVGSDVIEKPNSNPHVRMRRAARWSPDYDLYSQWAEEYYADYEAPELRSGGEDTPKGDLLDQLLEMGKNQTEEELQSERDLKIQRKENIEKWIMYGSWGVGGIFVFCVVKTFAKRFLWKKFTCDFCHVVSFKEKVANVVNNLVPGVYVHKNGRREFYTPTEEEIESLKEIQKLLYSAI